jgi:hypothetical protein
MPLIVFGAGGESIFNGFSIDTEAASPNIVGGVYIGTPGSCVFDASMFDTSNAPIGTPTFWIPQYISPSVAQPAIEIRNSWFNTPDATAPLIHTGGSTQLASNPPRLINPFNVSNRIPTKGSGRVTVIYDSGVNDINDVDYIASPWDRIIAYSTLTAAHTVTLPDPTTAGHRTVIVVKDESGNCNLTNTITVQVASSGTIDGVSSIILTRPYSFARIYSNGNNWFTE